MASRALYDDSDGDDSVPSFGVNKTFADAYKTKKQTEELSKCKLYILRLPAGLVSCTRARRAERQAGS